MTNYPKIWVHTLVRNEERYIWFSVMSVIDHIDKILIWDTGSEDNTVKIVDSIKKAYPLKIEYRQCGVVTAGQYTVMRQKMLDRTKADWLMILDGDEVWWEDSIKEVIKTIKKDGDKLDSIVTPYYNLVGDIYHYQDESAGNYVIDGEKGHLTIRFMNMNIPGLYTAKPHGQHGYFDGSGKLVQDRNSKRRLHSEQKFLHFTHLMRSSKIELDKKVPKRGFKLKYEIGRDIPLDFYYPEVFFKPRPNYISSPWRTMRGGFLLKSAIYNYPKKVKRKLFKGSYGY